MKRKLLITLAVVLAGGLIVAASVTLTGSGDVAPVPNDWSVTQQCTPVAPGDTSGHTGIGTVKADSRPTSVFAIDNDLALVDPNAGTFRGNVVSSAVEGGETTLSVLGKLNFLVADRTVDPVWFNAGSPSTFAPIGTDANGAGAGTIATPNDIAIDPYDNAIFVASYSVVNLVGFVSVEKYLVIKYDAGGNYVTQFGGPAGASGSANGQFGGPIGIAVSPVDGSVAVGDSVNSRFQIFTPNAGRTTYTYSTKTGTAGSGNGQFQGSATISVAYDSSGTLYATDGGNARIQKFTVSGTIVTYVSQVAITGFGSIRPVTKLIVAPGNTIYAALTPGRIRSYNTSLTELNTWILSPPAGTDGTIGSIASDTTGLWVAWGASNFLIHYVFAGYSVTEDNRWYSGFTFTPLAGSYRVAVKTTGEAAVLFGDPAGAVIDVYGLNRGLTFLWSPVPLSDAIENYMLECDATLGGLTYSYDASSDPNVIFPAWSGDVWSHLKEICTAFQLEIYLDGTVIRVDDVGSRTITLRNHSPLKVTPTNLFGGQQIVVVAQNPTAGGGIVYDASTQNTRFQIDVGQSQTVIVNTLNYPVSVDALVPTDTLPVLPGQYYVLDSLGAHVPAATWVSAGASVVGAVGDSPGQIRFTLQGPSGAINGYTGPFTFADSTASTGRAALTLTGTGVFTAPHSYTFETGANPTKTTQLIARTINSFAIADMTQVARVTPAAIDDVSGYAVEVTFEIPTADLLGFGLTQGALFYAEDSRYRVTNIQWGSLKSQITGSRHVTLDDLDTITAGLTVDQRDAIFSGYSIDDRGIKPLALAL